MAAWNEALVYAFIAVIAACAIMTHGGQNAFDWRERDAFDEIDDQMSAINRDNCASKPAAELHLSKDTLAQLPLFNKLLTNIIYPNRTNLLHLHNMALNRAFFYSYIMQKLTSAEEFYNQPGLLYYYLSAAADVSANEYGINGSAVMYDRNCSYANWYKDLAFNTTLPLFGPRAFRFDDYNEPTNWLREPTNKTINIEDYGAGPESDYTSTNYRWNRWYSIFLPDGWDQQRYDSSRKHTYGVDIKYSNETGRFVDDEYQSMVFFGPPSPGVKEEDDLPVKFTQPYFDCGRSNKWIVSAVSPVLDRLPRYLDEWFHLRRQKFVAASVMDIDFLQIDLNPCIIGQGNEAPNYFAGTAKCKPTTMCEPLTGWGFRRGGYQCMCRPGYRYPFYQHGPFQGADIESATGEEYDSGFDCLTVDLRQVIPNIRANTSVAYTSDRKKRSIADSANREVASDSSVHREIRSAGRVPATVASRKQSHILERRKRFLRIVGLKEEAVDDIEKRIVRRDAAPFPAIKRKRIFAARYTRTSGGQSRKKRQAFDVDRHSRMLDIIALRQSVTAKNCKNFLPDDLVLPGDVSYGAKVQFSPQARTALRLSHFISNFLQNINIYEEYGNLRGDKPLNTEVLFGEVLANVMGDLRIEASGVFYDIDKYKGPDDETRQFFGPYAYRFKEELGGDGTDATDVKTRFRAEDFAGHKTHYLDEEWFKAVKERWQSNTYGLDKFMEKPMIRSDIKGASLQKFDLYPLYYRAPREEDGWWSAPYFDCNEYINDWIITYSVPFFGLNSIGSDIEFKGIVRVDVLLSNLDIDQCPMDFYVPNAFKNTARCDYKTTECVALPGKEFNRGGYKCECKQGYEYPFSDQAWYFDGQTMEEEYRKKTSGLQNSFHTLKCRISGGGKSSLSVMLLVFAVALRLLQ